MDIGLPHTIELGNAMHAIHNQHVLFANKIDRTNDVICQESIARDSLPRHSISFLQGFDQTMASLQAEHAKLKRLYQLALAQLDRAENAQAISATTDDLNSYVEDRVQARTAALAARAAELEHLAHTDHLTGLPNRRAFLQTAHAELARIQRNGQAACVLLGDIDHFKAFNDCCGHAAGDRVLQTVAMSLRRQVRAADTVARWGGEEMIILLPETDLLGGQKVAEKCRVAIQNCPLACSDQLTSLSMTFGVSMIHPSECIDVAIARADRALYAGKNAGRNRVVTA